jgi:hypothetical protein
MTAMAEKQTLEIGKGKAGPGRPKGVPNKITTDLKRAILEAAEAAGGEGGTVGYLTAQAAANPAAFLTLIGKVLPTTVAGDPDSPLTTITRIELVAGGK